MSLQGDVTVIRLRKKALAAWLAVGAIALGAAAGSLPTPGPQQSMPAQQQPAVATAPLSGAHLVP